MQTYFDQLINRTNTSGTYSSKWQGFERLFPGFDVRGALPMWVADMDFLCPPEVVEAVTRQAAHGIYGYTSVEAVNAYKKATAGWLRRRHGYETSEDQMLFTPGVLVSMNACIQAFTDPGDGVIIQPPVYYPFANGIRNNGREVRCNSLIEKDGYYEIDFEQLESLAREPRTKLMILSSPHNPVGRVWKREELLRMADICQRNGVLIFSDEIHSDLIMKGYRHTPVGMLGEQYQKTFISAYSTSKAFNTAGLGAALTVIPDETLRNRAQKQMIANSVSFGNVFGPVAAAAAYEHGDQYLEDVLAYIEANIDYAKEYIEAHIPGVRLRNPEGTYLVWIDFRGTGLNGEEIYSRILERAKIAVDLGKWFGPEGEGFARFNFACPRTTVAEAMRRLENAFVR